MKFKLARSYLYWWPVEVRIPDPENAGRFIVQTLRLQLEPASRDEALAAQDRLAETATMREAIEHETEQLMRAVRDWDGVVDDEGAPVPFSAKAFREALQYSWFRTAVSQAIAASLNGEEARVGN